ncbi:MAG: signal transduction histidine kinase/HAMP domain-containing protein [Desulforhopalus sp.]|jgi:signal transduction histidine kinase/HAMP domain-containing protein
MISSIRNSLAGRFFLTIAVTVAVAMGCGTFISFVITNRSITESIQLQLQRQVTGAIDHIEIWLEGQRIQITSMGREKLFWSALQPQDEDAETKALVESRLSWIGLSYSYFSSMSLLNVEGDVVVSDLLEEERSQLQVDPLLLKRALAGELVVAPVFTSFHDQRFVFALYSAVTYGGVTDGVLYFEYDLKTVSDLFFTEIKTGRAGYTFLLDATNAVIVQSDERLIDPGELRRQFGDSKPIKDQFLQFFNGKTEIFAYSGFIDFLGCSLLLNIPYSEISLPSRQLGKINILITLMIIVFTVLVLTLLWRKEIATPIREIIQGMSEFQNGKFSRPVNTNFRNEFKTVAESFNKMAADIEHSTVSIEVLRDEQKSLHTILNSMIIGILIVDQDEQVMMINSSLLSILGSGKQGDGGAELFQKTRKESDVFSDLKKNKHQEVEFISVHGKEYSLLRVVQSISLNHADVFLVMFVDITDQKRAEKEQKNLENDLQAAGRMKAIGTLAAGISHEINTPIQYIGDNVRFVSDAMVDLLDLIATYRAEFKECRGQGRCTIKLAAIEDKEEDADLEYLKEEIPLSLTQSLNGLEDVGRIVLAMKSFSRQGDETMAPVDVNQSIENTLIVSRNEWKYFAQIDNVLDNTIPHPECITGDINQVLLNLIVNAAHAIEAKKLDRPLESEVISIKSFSKDGYVCISIADTGVGMSEDVKSRIFEYFFTTKDVGRGTGQGLSLAYQIVVEKHKGQLLVDSIEGQGSTFTVKLPVQSAEKK